jgi:hypothetical protein
VQFSEVLNWYPDTIKLVGPGAFFAVRSTAKNRAIRSNFCPCGAKIPLLSLALLTNGIHAICQL